MKIIIVVSCLLFVVSCSALAMQPAVVGGVRDGLAVGIMGRESVARNVALQFGLEANTGTQPIIVFINGKFYLTNVGRTPMSFCAGAVAYTGKDKTDAGLSLTLIFDRMFNISPLFLEAGVDVANKARLVLQLGYRIY